ncbi:IS110 family transposase [Jeotgalibacillus sp. R-1-5s-1]|uniref:IS110 family transposase n=1 Tax=Jeotgalibacillus sp. R-1-5s-1 TaxID=2555897 RepID=UPI00106BB3F5|nr:IS110 family transposase [Jeotgalibacillus sp. R-1-5s-1]TFD98319.1 IS110 family transposase [Jeotgalibacillus sp. R-1-5s-1]
MTYYVGIDVGKRQHEVGILDDHGKKIGKTCRFANSREGGQVFLDFLTQHGVTADNCLCGMEATGHYWLSLFSFLHEKAFQTTVFNPLQSDALRHLNIRKVKNDKVDAYLIAKLMRMETPEPTPFLDEDLIQIKQLARLRYSLVDQSSDLKRKVIAVLDQVFPEYEEVFSNAFNVSSKKLLKQHTIPEDFLNIDTEELANLLHEVSRKSYGIDEARDKASRLKACAENSFGIKLGADAFRLHIRLLLDQIMLIERQVKDVESLLSELSDRQQHHLTSIVGISDFIASVIIGEVGSIKRFDRAEQLVAYAGLDVSVFQSGEFEGRKNRLSKRGSPYLRRAIWQAALVASFHDPVLSEHYKQLRARGKAHGTACGAVARKLTHIIFAILRDQKPYEPRIPPKS